MIDVLFFSVVDPACYDVFPEREDMLLYIMNGIPVSIVRNPFRIRDIPSESDLTGAFCAFHFAAERRHHRETAGTGKLPCPAQKACRTADNLFE